MLRAMRTGKQSVILKGFFLLLLAIAGGGLVLMDVQGVFNRSVPQSAVATIAGEKLSVNEFDRMVQAAVSQQRVSQTEAYRNGLPQQVLDQEINARLFSRAAYDAGFVVDDYSAAQYVRSAFIQPLVAQGVNEKDALQYMLRSSGISEAQLLSSIKSQMGAENLLKVVALGAYAPAQLVNDALRFRYEARRAEYFTLTLKEIGSIAEPTEEDIKKHYEQTISRYMLPEYRSLSALVVDADALGIAPAVTDEEIAAYFDAHKRDYSTAEERAIEQLVVDDQETAARVRTAALAAGNDLKKAIDATGAKNASVIAGTFTEDNIAEPLATAFQSTAVGDISEPVQSPFGWHLVKVVKVTKPGTSKTLESVKAEIAKRLKTEKGADALYEQVNKIDDAIASGGATLEGLAAEYKLKPVSVEKIDASGFTPAGRKADLSALPVAEKAVEAAFALAEGTLSSLIETPEGAFVIVSPVSVTAPEAKPLEAVKRDVVQSWKTERRNALLDEKAAQVMERLNMGENFEAVAKSFDKSVSRSDFLRRDSDAAKAPLGRGMLPALFSIEKSGQSVTVRGEDSLSFMRLLDRKVDMPKGEGDEKQPLQQALSRAMQEDLISQFRQGLMEKYKVKINQSVIESTYNPDKVQ